MKTKLYTLVIILFLSLNALAQEYSNRSTAKNAVFVELLGNSVIGYNITYDRIIFSIPSLKVSTGLGVQYVASEVKFIGDHINHHQQIFWGIAPQVNLLFPLSSPWSMELGLGLTIFTPNLEKVFIPFRLGYRFQTTNTGLFFKLAATSIMAPGGVVFFDTVYHWIPLWPSLALGVSF